MFMSASQSADAVRIEIATARKVAGLSQDELAKRSGVPRGTIAGIEAGNHEPKRKTLRRLAKALGVPLLRWERMLDGLPPDADFSSEELAAILDEQDPELRRMLIDAFSLPPELRHQFAAVVRAALSAVQAARQR